MSELKAPGKSFAISKREVWEAWGKVKANKGAPGVDGCSIVSIRKSRGGAVRRWCLRGRDTWCVVRDLR
jgi:hypothetical protein